MIARKPISLEGRVAEADGKLVMLIPLRMGGKDLIECSRGIGEVEGENLKVTIPDWLAAKLGLSAGSLVEVNNDGGRFNITAVEAAPSFTRRN